MQPVFTASLMFLGSFAAGSLPLITLLSLQHTNLLSSYGAGLLVGTSFIVIIPEGISTLSKSFADLHSFIGLSLSLGFILMFLIDNIAASHSHSAIPSHINIAEMRNVGQVSSHDSTTIGLILHAAADGIALGVTSGGKLEMVVFFAIMIHKAPSAFGLTTFLLKEGKSRKDIRKHLIMFSLAAPISSLLTSLIVHMFAIQGDMNKWTGLLLLFSAGTFLYVSLVHVLPECYNVEGNERLKKLDNWQVLLVVVGVFTPMVLYAGHSH